MQWKKNSFFYHSFPFTDLALRSYFHYADGTFPFLRTKREVRLQIVLDPSLKHTTGK